MENEKKGNSSQSVLNVILVIICAAIMGLFIYDYMNKNDQIAEYKKEALNRERDNEEQYIKKVKKIATIYKQTSFNNASDGLVSDEENEQIKEDIAKNVSSHLSPIMSKLDETQGMTNDKLDKIMNELISLLEKETKKSALVRKKMASAIAKERKIEKKLQFELMQTQKIVADLNGMVGDLKGKYISEHEDDSGIGDIIRCATAPAKFVRNTFTFDWFHGTDKRKAEKVINAKQLSIIERYDAIGDPQAQRELKMKKKRRAAEKAKRKSKKW